MCGTGLSFCFVNGAHAIADKEGNCRTEFSFHHENRKPVVQFVFDNFLFQVDCMGQPAYLQKNDQGKRQ